MPRATRRFVYISRGTGTRFVPRVAASSLTAAVLWSSIMCCAKA